MLNIKRQGVKVVMSIEVYEQIAETQLIDNAILEAEEEYELLLQNIGVMICRNRRKKKAT